MPYVTQEQLAGLIPATFLVEALDDNGDGVADEGVFDQVAADVAEKIEGLLGGRFAVPFSEPFPPPVKSAAKWFAIAELYSRRGKADLNPYKSENDSAITLLTEIGLGKAPLSPEVQRKKPPVSVIERRAKTVLKHGGTLA